MAEISVMPLWYYPDLKRKPQNKGAKRKEIFILQNNHLFLLHLLADNIAEVIITEYFDK